MAKIFFTSDTFFGRTNIIEMMNRPFEDVDEMNVEIVRRWNSKVGKNDTVYHLGNFAWDPITASFAIELLNGKIFFILGNSDDALKEVLLKGAKNMKIIKDQIIELPDLNLVASHYPLEVWNGKDFGVIHCHGHSPEMKTDLKKSLRVNCCIDNWDYYPVEYSTILDIIKTAKGEE
jgi:calcineurin-like phosphoesterase family protein